ncbi:hypothetical protein RND81_03G203700 [Saponaria officinalis]|uniref:DUF4378 domain-containing protein n=1 Tax=Saponaria officinalis TaxID=3572 RepID=A0AAW1M8V8_SAPOF
MASKNGKQYTTQTTPKMLKEYLQEINTTPLNSSSCGFTSFPRRLPHQPATTLPRSRSRSRAAAETALTSVTKLLSSVNSSLSTILDRWSFRNKMRSKNKTTVSKVKVKDILRWRSFRDAVVIAEESSSKLQVEFGDVRVFQTASTCSDMVFPTTATDCSSSSEFGLELGLESDTELSKGESDGFRCSMDELPCWWGNVFDEGVMWDHDNDVVATVSGVASKEDNHNNAMEDEKEQRSPVSVLDSPFREEVFDHEFESSFDQSLANMERTKQSLLERIQWLENLAGVSEEEGDETELVHEEELRRDDNTVEAIAKGNLSKVVGKFVRGEQGFKDKAACIREMEENWKWTSKFEEEKKELGVELGVELVTDLVDEVLVDLFGRRNNDIVPMS